MTARDRDEEREERIKMEIIVDAYTPEEQAMGWHIYLEETMDFPFEARCIEEKDVYEVGSEAIAQEYRVGIHANRIDFQEHVKIGVLLGIIDPKTLDDLDQQTDVRDGVEPISQGQFSRLTTRRPWQAFAALANALLQLPEFYHSSGDLRLQLDSDCCNSLPERLPAVRRSHR